MTASNDDEQLTAKEIDARREAGLKRLLATPPKPDKKKGAEPKPGASPSLKDDRQKLGTRGKDGGKAKQARR